MEYAKNEKKIKHYLQQLLFSIFFSEYNSKFSTSTLLFSHSVSSAVWLELHMPGQIVQFVVHLIQKPEIPG